MTSLEQVKNGELSHRKTKVSARKSIFTQVNCIIPVYLSKYYLYLVEIFYSDLNFYL
jgi:hypothetical protein